MYDLVIKNGELITAENRLTADLAIENGKILKIGTGLEGKKFIPADGLYVLPGGVDPHVHLQMPLGDTASSDTWETGTIAAACGGTTTLIDFVEPEPDESMLHALEARRTEAEGQARIDYSLHMTITTAMMKKLDEIPAVLEAGISSFKLYTTYSGMLLNDYQMLEAMQAVAEAGGMVLVHCENDAITRFHTKTLLEEKHFGPDAHPLSRPAEAEEEAVNRVLKLAQTAGVKIYIVHISTAGGAAALCKAAADGLTAFGETCPQYLLLSEEKYSGGFEAAKYVCAPPLRNVHHQQILWQYLNSSKLHSIGTDHCPFFYTGQKDIGRDNFTNIPGGLPGIQSRVALLHTYGVLEGHINLNQWVALCSTNPAQIFGLYPQKGTLQPGSDADFVLFDPNHETTITRENLSENVDYSPYEGFKLKGLPVQVHAQGKLIASDGKFTGTDHTGEFIRRTG